jgi:hypothetical protein
MGKQALDTAGVKGFPRPRGVARLIEVRRNSPQKRCQLGGLPIVSIGLRIRLASNYPFQLRLVREVGRNV